MISIVSAADGEAVRQLLVLATVASVVLAAVLAGGARTERALATVLAVGGVLVIAGLTLSPVRGLPGEGCATRPDAPLDDVPNVVLFFVPMLFAVVATRRPVVVLLAGPVLSAAIEWGQDVVPSLGRRCDVDDLLANSAGSVAAVLVGSVIVGVAHIERRRRRLRQPLPKTAAPERALHSVR